MSSFDDLIGKKSPDVSIGNDNNDVSKNEGLLADVDKSRNSVEKTNSEIDKKVGSTSHNKNKKTKRSNTLDVFDILSDSLTELFVDQIGEAHAAVRVKDHIESIPINSDRFRGWIIKAHYDFEKHLREIDLENPKPFSILSNEEAAKIQTIIKLEAEEQNNVRRLEIRVAGNVDSDADSNDDSAIIFYDLCNKDGEIIKVTKNGWEVVKHGFQLEKKSSRTIVFKHYRNQSQQIAPSTTYPENVFAQFLSLTNLPVDDIETEFLQKYI